MTHEELIEIESIRHWYQIPFATAAHALMFGWLSACTVGMIWVFWVMWLMCNRGE